MHKGKVAIICKFKYAEICTKYAKSVQKYAVAHAKKMQWPLQNIQ